MPEVRYNEKYATYEEAIMDYFFPNLSKEEVAKLTLQEYRELVRLVMLEVEPVN